MIWAIIGCSALACVVFGFLWHMEERRTREFTALLASIDEERGHHR